MVDYNGIELISGGSQGAAQKYPWPQFPSNPTGEDYDANYEAVNTAQLKYLFSWRILTNDLLPLSSDGFPSGWYEGLDGTSQEYAAAASLVLEAVSASSVRCADNSENQIKVRVRDMRGNPVANVSVAFSLGPADGGASISATQVTTDSNGEASLIFTKGTGRMVRGNVDDEWGNSALCRRDITGSMYFEIYVSDVNESGWATISFSNLRKRMIPEYYLPSEGSDNSGEEEEDNDLRGSTLLGSQGFIDINCPIPAWRIKFEGREFSMPASESSGPKYRKISLLGRPISDDKPQTESESVFSPPETFIDAFTLNLRHDCVDYVQPIPNSELVLAVRRNYSQESWTLRNGLRPHERPDSPFGAGWSSNLAPSVVLELTTTNDLSSITSPSMARVTDENGMSFSFAITGTGNMRKFYPMPNSKSDAQSFLNKLYFNSDGKLIFEKKYGTRLEFENIEAIRSIPSNRFSNGYPIISYDYYRLKRVEDKYGNALIYEYQDSEYDEKLLLPSRIYYNKNPNVFICIESNYDGNVTSIYGPEGVKIAYSYDYFGHNSDNLSSYETRGLYDGFYALTSVSLMDGDTSEMLFNYAYTGVTYEKDIWHIISGGEVFSDFSHCHFDLSEITDGAGNVYEFEYAPFETNYMVSSANGAPDDVVSKEGDFFNKGERVLCAEWRSSKSFESYG